MNTLSNSNKTKAISLPEDQWGVVIEAFNQSLSYASHVIDYGFYEAVLKEIKKQVKED